MCEIMKKICNTQDAALSNRLPYLVWTDPFHPVIDSFTTNETQNLSSLLVFSHVVNDRLITADPTERVVMLLAAVGRLV